MTDSTDQERLEEAILPTAEREALEEGGEEASITMQSILKSLSPDFDNVLSSLRTFTQNGVEQVAVLGAAVKEQVKSLSADFELKDWFSVEGLFYLTLLVVVIVCVLTISLNIYRKIRYAIPATVNCWFCNCNSKVLYSLRDTWTCPTCHQYNGFTTDGNYNKRIPAQFIEALNRPIRGYPPQGYEINRRTNNNGLCSQCNLNQVLKVFQLASFQPVNERNFGVEIEAEQKRLEQLYDICSQCKLVVEEMLKRTPEKQQLPMRRKANVNKVAPHSPSTPTERAKVTA